MVDHFIKAVLQAKPQHLQTIFLYKTHKSSKKTKDKK